ncbi:MAG TPA: hypothetical protein VLG47_01255 [Candidatus Saccharimonadales bacterium]|nr:hypothetical protein [Candidatus Saccharimonadales bacterium]
MALYDATFDPFQEAWKNPAAQFPIFVDEEYGLMVIPDALPAVDHQVLVICREQTPYQELPASRQLQMMTLANITAEYMDKVLKPKRKIGYAVWGNQIKTAHIHLLPRNVPDDGIKFFVGEKSRQTQQQLKETQKLLNFPIALQRKAKKQLEELASKF